MATEQASTQRRHKRKTLKGVVVSNKMDKTVVVRVDEVIRHPRYQKVVKRFKKYYAHDEAGTCAEGETVTIMETRPYSKLKCWRVVDAVTPENAG